MINARLALLLSLIVSHASIASAVDVVIYDNLSNVSESTIQATNTKWLAQRFTTDQIYSLSSVTLFMRRDSLTAYTGAVVEIYSNSNTNNPDSSLYTLTSPDSYSDTLAPTTFTASGFNLAANSDYWVVLKSVDDSTPFYWSWTLDDSGSGSGFTTIWRDTGNSGVSWSGDDTAPYQMRVTVQPVPEPSSMILAGLGVIVVGFAAKRRKKPVN